MSEKTDTDANVIGCVSPIFSKRNPPQIVKTKKTVQKCWAAFWEDVFFPGFRNEGLFLKAVFFPTSGGTDVRRLKFLGGVEDLQRSLDRPGETWGKKQKIGINSPCCYLVGGFKYVSFSPLFGEMIQFE